MKVEIIKYYVHFYCQKFKMKTKQDLLKTFDCNRLWQLKSGIKSSPLDNTFIYNNTVLEQVNNGHSRNY